MFTLFIVLKLKSNKRIMFYCSFIHVFYLYVLNFSSQGSGNNIPLPNSKCAIDKI